MNTLIIIGALIFLVASGSCATYDEEDLIYGYECKNQRCVKTELSADNLGNATSLPVCRMFCANEFGTVWPKPSGNITFEPSVLQINTTAIEFHFTNVNKTKHFWSATKERFLNLLDTKIPKRTVVQKGGHVLQIFITTREDNVTKLTLDTDEDYVLSISPVGNKSSVITANITAKNYFGARHGLETLSQLIVYDDIRNEVQIAAKVNITDGPAYKWRGVLLDTSRSFYAVDTIKRTLDAMAMVKLNTFHWHLTDSQSFPIEIKKQKDLYKLGAYSPQKVYTHADVIEIVEYGKIRGIRVMPEFDAPAHVGEGWQHKNMTACFNAQPWKKFCGGPPCGHLDPTVTGLYSVLEDIYSEMFELFEPDVFHMGGDEVSVNCWNSSERIQNWMLQRGWGLNESDFMRLWGVFQTEALARVDQVSQESKVPITLWTSRLTDVPYIDEYLDKDRYIIQIWTTGDDPKIQDILNRGFRIIISNYDALYFDCGGASWVSEGNNWCSPYIGWQKVYDNSLDAIGGVNRNGVLGAEAAVWSAQISESTLDSRFWPRASALAERLWSNANITWRQAESRMLIHRERLVENGIGAEPLQPEWCLQNQNECPIDAYD